MVSDGAERCEACGAVLAAHVMDERTGFTWKDFVSYSLYPLLLSLAVLGFALVVGGLCYYLYLIP